MLRDRRHYTVKLNEIVQSFLSDYHYHANALPTELSQLAWIFIDSRNSKMWSGPWSKAHFRNLLANTYRASTVNRALEWWSRGCGFNPHWEQFFDIFFCSSLCRDLSDNREKPEWIKYNAKCCISHKRCLQKMSIIRWYMTKTLLLIEVYIEKCMLDACMRFKPVPHREISSRHQRKLHHLAFNAFMLERRKVFSAIPLRLNAENSAPFKHHCLKYLVEQHKESRIWRCEQHQLGFSLMLA